MALGRIISILLAITLISSLLFVSGCSSNPGPEDMFVPENLEEIEKANPYSVEYPEPGSSNESFDIEKFFPKE
jgi:PBP1b-binding outer membrane lipoprotein LpoB